MTHFYRHFFMSYTRNRAKKFTQLCVVSICSTSDNIFFAVIGNNSH